MCEVKVKNIRRKSSHDYGADEGGREKRKKRGGRGEIKEK